MPKEKKVPYVSHAVLLKNRTGSSLDCDPSNVWHHGSFYHLPGKDSWQRALEPPSTGAPLEAVGYQHVQGNMT